MPKTCRKHNTEYIKQSGIMRCPECRKETYSKYDTQHATQRKQWQRSRSGKDSRKKYRLSDKGKTTNRIARRKRKMENCSVRQGKEFARRAVIPAIKEGTLVRPSICSLCEHFGKIEAHHYLGYSQEHWLNVQWCCRSCHLIQEKIKS